MRRSGRNDCAAVRPLVYGKVGIGGRCDKDDGFAVFDRIARMDLDTVTLLCFERAAHTVHAEINFELYLRPLCGVCPIGSGEDRSCRQYGMPSGKREACFYGIGGNFQSFAVFARFYDIGRIAANVAACKLKGYVYCIALVIEFYNGTAVGGYRAGCLYDSVYFGKSGTL